MPRLVASTTFAFFALTLLASPPAKAEPPPFCGWRIDTDGMEFVPIDEPARVFARLQDPPSCKGNASLDISVVDAAGVDVPGRWDYEGENGMVAWSPDDGWPTPGYYLMTLVYVDPSYDPWADQRTEVVLEVGGPPDWDGYGIQFTEVRVTGQDEPVDRCCAAGAPCWVETCILYVRAGIMWQVTGPGGSQAVPMPWLRVLVEAAPSPADPPRQIWLSAIDDPPLARQIEAVPMCFRARLQLDLGGQLAETPWRCVEDFEPIAAPCEEAPEPVCPDPDPDVDGGLDVDGGRDAGGELDADGGLGPDRGLEADAGAESDVGVDPDPVLDHGIEYDARADGEPGDEAPSEHRSDCAVAAPTGGRSDRLAWFGCLLLAGRRMRRAVAGRPRRA